MSGPHPTLSLWTHDEETGGYTAEIHDVLLKVTWTPNQGDQRGHFRWSAAKGDEATYEDPEHFEEMELAMAAAEAYAS